MNSTDYNNLPVHSGWGLGYHVASDAKENMKTYQALRAICTHGERPLGLKVVVRQSSYGRGRMRFHVVSNPIGLDIQHIALYCDNGSLAFGFYLDHSTIVINDG